jgi:hypothetical protein
MARPIHALLYIVCLSTAGCPTHAQWIYDCQGRLLNPDGTPARGVAIHVDTEKPGETGVTHGAPWWETVGTWSEDQQPWWWKGRNYVAQTDENGQFMTNCVFDVDEGWWGGSDTVLRWEDHELTWVRLPAPELPRVWLWVKSSDGWRAIQLDLGKEAQKRTTPGSRELDLPPVRLSVPAPPTRQSGRCAAGKP